MAILVADGSAYVRRLEQIVYNPGRKFITLQQELDSLNIAALLYASKMGGIQFTDNSLSTLALQLDYPTPTTWLEVYYLEIITSPNTPQEKAQKIFITPYQRLQDFSNGLPSPALSSGSFSTFNRTALNLHIEPPPSQTGLLIRAQVFGMPNQFSNNNVLVDGPVEQIETICLAAAASIRRFTRDTEEAASLKADSQEAEEAAVMARSQQNKVYQASFKDRGNPEHLRRY